MGKAKDIRSLYNLFKEDITKFEIVDIDSGTEQIINQESIIMNEETLGLMSNNTKEKLNELINEYDCVFVKLNEAAGIDAKFLLTQLKCFTIEDIMILIKGSERMIEAFDKEKIGSYIVVKEWYKIEERNEFRCFIVDKEIKGISQRYINSNANYSTNEIDQITLCIKDFFEVKKVKSKLSKFESEMGDNSKEEVMYIIDVVYLPKKNKVKIIDLEFIYYNEDITKDKLKLFNSIQELKEIKEELEFRIIKSDDDPRIPQYESNSNQFPLELYETDIQTLINQLDIK